PGESFNLANRMGSSNPVEPSAFPFRIRDITLGIILVGFILALVGIVSYFRLSSEATVLRESAMGAVNGVWNKKIAVRVGFFTTALVRAGSRFFKLPPEPRAALDSICAAEVGVYELQDAAGCVDNGAILARADKAMSARCWDRVVGVSHKND